MGRHSKRSIIRHILHEPLHQDFVRPESELRARAAIRGHLLLWSSKSAAVTKARITVAILCFDFSRQANKGNWVQGKMSMFSRLITF